MLYNFNNKTSVMSGRLIRNMDRTISDPGPVALKSAIEFIFKKIAHVLQLENFVLDFSLC